MLGAIAYPLVTARGLEAFGPRVVAGGILGAGLLSAVLLARRLPGLPGLGPFARVGLLALPALTLATGDFVFLMLMPAAVELVLCALFVGSLRDGGSILEEMARWIEPYAPGFIRSYCRTATVAYAALFALQAVGFVVLALRPPPEGWAVVSTLWTWVPPVVGTALEWMVRKAWFRHYGRGPVDRLLRALLPPENTARGRRSLEHIRRMRRELGLPPP